MLSLLAFAVLSIAPVSAQTAVSVSASRSAPVTTDQVELSISVTADLTRTQDEVVAALAPIGVKSEQLTELSSSGTVPTSAGLALLLRYAFSLTVPTAAWKETLNQLQSLSRTPPDGLRSFYYSSRLVASPAVLERARQALLPDVIAEARKNADALALAAGFRLGALLSVAEASSSYGGTLSISITARFARN